MQAADGADRDEVSRLERLLEVGPGLTSELDLPAVLERILATARELTGAQYAALGVLDDRRRHLERFVTAGIDAATRDAIGAPPHGHGILGLLIDRPEAIRLSDVSAHPRSYGFPQGHPPMHSFLGLPITVRGEVWGNLYLTEKHGGADFDDADLNTACTLAAWAGVAIDNAGRFAEAAGHQLALERSVRALQTTMDIATAVGADTDLTRNLDLIVRRGRELVGADALLIWLVHDDDLRIAASAGNAEVPVTAMIPLGSSTAGEALDRGRSVRIDDGKDMLVDPSQFGMSRASPLLIVPLVHRGTGLGVLMAFGAADAPAGFDADAQRSLEAFAVSAATAVAIAHSVETRRLHDTLAAAESERQRWARELHDETLQGLASLKLSLSLSLKAPPGVGRTLVQDAVEHVALDIASLRTIIADLRPPTLDELGLEPALRELAERVAAEAGLVAELSFDLSDVRLSANAETVAYRVAQEALTNIVKHAQAHHIRLYGQRMGLRGLRLIIEDDGIGVEHERAATRGRGEGYGLVGMRERAELGAGTLLVETVASGGTRVTLELPPD